LNLVSWTFKGILILLYTLVFSVVFIIIIGMSYGIVKETIKHFNPPPVEETT
jgi:hypothetical protein